ncbi:MAG: hypothetical protein PHT07_24220 [Paludibacter sp.]|nr:hypothetical protein [Paludibacter sp.]
MKEDINFQKIGKKLPYQVPDGFFEQIPERTLQKAKERTRAHQHHLVLSMALTVIAAAAVILFIFVIPGEKPKPDAHSLLTTQENQQIMKPAAPEKQLTVLEPMAEVTEAVTKVKKTEGNITREEMNHEKEVSENIEDILNDLSDEELLQIAAIYKTDVLIDVLAQETSNLN